MSSEIEAVFEPDDSGAQAWDAAGESCAAPSAERRLRMLDRLAEAGLQIALAIERKVKEAGPEQTLAELNLAAEAYARTARGVRLAVLLQDQLSRGGEDPEETARQAEAERRKAQVDRAVRVVRRVAKDHCRHEPFAASAYAREAADRLDDDDIYGLVATRPLGELVALICRDLGLQPNWDALAEEAWAQAEIESGAEGSPFLQDYEDVDGEAPQPEPWRPRSLEDTLADLARDPAVLAAAHRDSG